MLDLVELVEQAQRHFPNGSVILTRRFLAAFSVVVTIGGANDHFRLIADHEIDAARLPAFAKR